MTVARSGVIDPGTNLQNLTSTTDHHRRHAGALVCRPGLRTLLIDSDPQEP